MGKLPDTEFDLFELLDETLLPTDSIDIYTNINAAHKLNKLLEEERVREEARAKKAKATKKDTYSLGDADVDDFDVEAFEAELNAAYEELQSSKVVFELKGLAPELIKAITAEKTAKHNHKLQDMEDKAFFEDLNTEIISRTIVGVVKGESRDPQPYTQDRVFALEKKLHPTQWATLYNAAFELNYDAEVFDRAVNADFLAKR